MERIDEVKKLSRQEQVLRRRILFIVLPPVVWLVAVVLAFKICFPFDANRYDLGKIGVRQIRLDRATGDIARLTSEGWKKMEPRTG